MSVSGPASSIWTQFYKHRHLLYCSLIITWVFIFMHFLFIVNDVLESNLIGGCKRFLASALLVLPGPTVTVLIGNDQARRETEAPTLRWLSLSLLSWASKTCNKWRKWPQTQLNWRIVSQSLYCINSIHFHISNHPVNNICNTIKTEYFCHYTRTWFFNLKTRLVSHYVTYLNWSYMFHFIEKL